MNLPNHRIFSSSIAAATLAAILGSFTASAGAEETTIDLSSADAAGQWKFVDSSASIVGGELRLDGRRRMATAFYDPAEWEDVVLRADFQVQPQKEGVLACGFIIRAENASYYYYVHFDRTQAILVRADESRSWNEIARVSNLAKPAGQWHAGEVSCVGSVLKVSLNGKTLLEAKDASLGRGRIGFYASQGLAQIKNIRVTGKPLTPTSKLTIPPPSHVIVCDDAGAGAYEAFPDVCRLADGRLMAIFYAGYGHVAYPNEKLPLGGRIAYCTSSDEGRTWSQPKTLYDGPDDDRDPSIVQLKDGRLLCNFFSLRPNPRPKKGERRHLGLGTWVVESSDGGESWSKPRRISKTYYCSSPIRELSNGRLILGLYAATTESANGAVITSDDGGKTWSKEIDIDNQGERLDAETDVIELADGSLLAAQRQDRPSKATGKPTMFFATSRDKGDTWTASRPLHFPGHCPYLLRTVDDILIVAHRMPNTSLHYSLDAGKTWSENVPIDAAFHGAYPSMVNLRDGSVLVVYYEEGVGSNILAKRFRASKKGIEWLPMGDPEKDSGEK